MYNLHLIALFLISLLCIHFISIFNFGLFILFYFKITFLYNKASLNKLIVIILEICFSFFNLFSFIGIALIDKKDIKMINLYGYLITF